MTTNAATTDTGGTEIREDEGGGGGGLFGADDLRLVDYNNVIDGQQSLDIFVRHVSQQLQREQQRCAQRAAPPPSDAIELPTLNGVVMRRKQQLQQRHQQQQQQQLQKTNTAIANTDTTTTTTNSSSGQGPKGRPLSISSISSAASSGSNSSNNSSTSSGIQSSLTRNGSLNYGHEYKKHAYLASIESLDSSHAGNEAQAIEEELKNLKLLSPSSGQFRDAAARAAVLAAGAQSRGFHTPGGRISRINRSFHASLRYDKSTAQRIYTMASARAFMSAVSSPKGANGDLDDDHEQREQRRGGSVSRNNSSTSSDSGHQRLTSFKSSKSICQCDSSPSITLSSSSSQVEQTSSSASKESSSDSCLVMGKKAATLDSGTCQRGSGGGGATVKHHLDCSYSRIRPRRASAKLQPSPSSASSNSNTSSLFRDDGFEDDLLSTTSDRMSSIYHQHRRLSFQGRDQAPTRRKYHPNTRTGDHDDHHHHNRHHDEDDDDDEEEEYQSCEEDFSNSRTTASTSSNIDDCALSTTSSSLMQVEQQVLDKISLANAKQHYRRSLLLEHHQQKQHLLHSQQQQQQQHAAQNKIQALLTPPSPKISHLSGFSPSQSSNNTSVASTNTSGGCTPSPPLPPKQTKCDDRTVNIIRQTPTRSPGYWDSNLSITQRVVTEIIETERTYVDDLEQIVTGYICYLRNILKQHKRQQQSQNLDHHRQHRNHESSNSQQQQQSKMVTPNESASGDVVVVDEDDKSMFIFDDDTTSATNELADDYDVEEMAENDIAAIKENLSSSSSHAKANGDPKSNGNQHQQHQQQQSALISAGHIKELFSNLEDIYKFNKDLLFRLEECYLNPSSVAECFVENSAGFEVYTHYCTMYPQVVSTLTELMKNQASAQLLRERQNELNQGLPLGAYLLKPVQRILKYHILFQSLIKHTSDDDSVDEKDRQLISEAFSVMTSIACHINVMKRRHEHAIRVQEIQGLLSDWEGPDLTTLGELILEDTFKLFNRPKSTRHIFLFDNVLLITKKKRDGSLSYKGHIACSNLMLIENIEGHPLVFNTVPFDNPKSLCAFQAKTLDKKRDWCLQIKEVIIKSFEVKIPVHVKDILMGLTTNGTNTEASPKSTSDSSRAVRAPNYLERKRSKQDKKK